MENVDDKGALGNDGCASCVLLCLTDRLEKFCCFYVRVLVVAGRSDAVRCLHRDDQEES